MSPRYSLVIPAYKDAEGLAQTFRFFQTCPTPVELVIIDDCSPDNTEEVVAAADLPDSVTLVYHRQSVNQGPGAARNLGIEMASCERLLFLDADDLLMPYIFDCLDQVALSEDFVLFKHHLAVQSTRIHSYNMHQRDRQFFSDLPTGRYPMESFRLADCPAAAATVNFPWNKLYRRSFLLEQNIRFPDQRMHEDILFHWQCFLRARHFGVLNWAPPLVTHFELPASDRATQYVGEKRLEAVPLLHQVEAELWTHDAAQDLEPVFATFCNDLFSWLINELKVDEEGNSWSAQYRAAAQTFWDSSRITPPAQPKTNPET